MKSIELESISIERVHKNKTLELVISTHNLNCYWTFDQNEILNQLDTLEVLCCRDRNADMLIVTKTRIIFTHSDECFMLNVSINELTEYISMQLLLER